MRRLTDAEKTRVREALAAGRSGAASLSQLASAYELSASVGAELGACTAELRLLMLRRLGADGSRLGRDVALGVVTGLLTHSIAKGI